ncbi:olfactory receptor 2D3-like [Ictidomys tridecemlineatus]|uniref:olfactory receptor 2D3-like n=1 Tax=Ictidomys tridecemlineatus TaxID=43179 RepID=UPI0006807D5A|nr:olfactory receptor 2D3-like [Ictidomys tridecemlineatus]KAG3285813.1 olfactory receptor 2D3-like [Ictidomys tridecemlineatus]
MCRENKTYLTEFILLGLSSDHQTQILLFVVFLIIYLLTVFGNLLIILLVHTDTRLHTPMYFFLKNLSFTDFCFSTTIVPKMLSHFLVVRKTISFIGCSTQMFFFLVMGCTESSLLAVMSYDRYVAVCKPLHYSAIMTHRVCVLLVIGSWVSGVFVSLVDTTFTLCLPYQGPNIINHYFCEPPALLKLYGSGIFAYMRPNSKTTKERDKMISVFYTVVTPMLNPIIYSLRNKDVKGALQRVTAK